VAERTGPLEAFQASRLFFDERPDQPRPGKPIPGLICLSQMRDNTAPRLNGRQPHDNGDSH